ncbi:unnamed protein product [Cyprideis torosa]|uniref:Uncharacterized protein n=1 Tax=Cyprideis torosa TaxID=163714 RepID=A0A7R8W5B2_9CRUS|nr:unnamed protein product [Cyprideis torosa]CAG0884067.1 unnamed protein product [Cyprideis torosa]
MKRKRKTWLTELIHQAGLRYRGHLLDKSYENALSCWDKREQTCSRVATVLALNPAKWWFRGPDHALHRKAGRKRIRNVRPQVTRKIFLPHPIPSLIRLITPGRKSSFHPRLLVIECMIIDFKRVLESTLEIAMSMKIEEEITTIVSIRVTL